MVSELKLAEMLCTRLCHDLTGPIGAVNNGAEFLEEEGFNMQNEAVGLILSSANEAVHRLQFYRQAYGRVGDHGEACLSDKKQLVEEFFSTTKITLDWPDNHAAGSDVSISQKMGRLIMNLLIIAAGGLLKGGTIAIRLDEKEQKKHISIKADGDLVKMDDDLLRILRHEAELSQLTPKTAQVALTLTLIDELDAVMDVTVDETHIAFDVFQEIIVSADIQAS